MIPIQVKHTSHKGFGFTIDTQTIDGIARHVVVALDRWIDAIPQLEIGDCIVEISNVDATKLSKGKFNKLMKTAWKTSPKQPLSIVVDEASSANRVDADPDNEEDCFEESMNPRSVRGSLFSLGSIRQKETDARAVTVIIRSSRGRYLIARNEVGMWVPQGVCFKDESWSSAAHRCGKNFAGMRIRVAGVLGVEYGETEVVVVFLAVSDQDPKGGAEMLTIEEVRRAGEQFKEQSAWPIRWIDAIESGTEVLSTGFLECLGNPLANMDAAKTRSIKRLLRANSMVNRVPKNLNPSSDQFEGMPLGRKKKQETRVSFNSELPVEIDVCTAREYERAFDHGIPEMTLKSFYRVNAKKYAEEQDDEMDELLSTIRVYGVHIFREKDADSWGVEVDLARPDTATATSLSYSQAIVVANIDALSPAKMKLSKGDHIIEINGTRIKSLAHARTLLNASDLAGEEYIDLAISRHEALPAFDPHVFHASYDVLESLLFAHTGKRIQDFLKPLVKYTEDQKKSIASSILKTRFETAKVMEVSDDLDFGKAYSSTFS